MKYFLIIFYLVLTTCYIAKAQYPKEFPADNTAFAKSYSEYIKSTCTRDDCKQLADKLPQAVTSGKAATYFPKIKTITQSMLNKKAPAFPVLFNFANMLLTIDNAKASTVAIDKNFDILQSLIDNSKSGNLKEFDNYVQYISNLYSKNALYFSNTNIWKSTGDYTVEFKNNRPIYYFASTELIGSSSVDTIIIKMKKEIIIR